MGGALTAVRMPSSWLMPLSVHGAHAHPPHASALLFQLANYMRMLGLANGCLLVPTSHWFPTLSCCSWPMSSTVVLPSCAGDVAERAH